MTTRPELRCDGEPRPLPLLHRRGLLCVTAVLLCALGPRLASAQATAQTIAQATAPVGGDADVRRMIDSLRGAAQGGSRTRNLVVVPNAEREPAATPAATPVAAPGAAPPAGASSSTPPSSLSLAIAFEPGSAQLRSESGATLGALVAAMLSPELRGNQFVIEGHTDANGSPAQNLRLSRERAEQVRLYLVTLGVAGERLRAVGKGASEPVNAQNPRAAENRRVVVLALP